MFILNSEGSFMLRILQEECKKSHGLCQVMVRHILLSDQGYILFLKPDVL